LEKPSRPQHPQVKIGICFQNRYNATAQAIRSRLDSAELDHNG
jgi:hypothetical protein